jgi:GT2 family glycosyltransferase
MPDIRLEPPGADIEPAELDVKAIAFYLPQFHCIPENDEWWGKGFTEWTSVRRGRPQFWDHYQPHVPHPDIGYYDLTDASVMENQMQMARQFGIYGFCFYYYWFNGRRLLEMPTNRLVSSGKPDFPFCFCWANHHWTRGWDGHEGEVLMAQEESHGSDERFIRDMLPAFRDPRYIRINGRPLLVLYRPGLLSDPKATFAHWREFCRREGIGEIYLAGFKAFDLQDPEEFGMDAAVECPHHSLEVPNSDDEELSIFNNFRGKICDYKKVAENFLNAPAGNSRLFRNVMPSWDNTARRQGRGIIFIGSKPDVYCRWLHRAVLQTRRLPNPDERVIFINAWNEWAEGAHLEPDERYRYAWLNATRLALEAGSSRRSAAVNSGKALQNIVKNLSRDLKIFLANGHRLSFRAENSPDVSVIVVMSNQAQFTLGCLRAVLAQAGVSFELLLVVDCSTDAILELLARLDNVRVFWNCENAGFLLAANQAAAEARGRTILFLHSDAFMRENALAIARQTLDSDDRIGAVGGRLILASGQLQEAGNIIWNDASVHAYGQNSPPDAGEVMFRRDVDYCSGAFLLTPRAVFEQMGGLNAMYAPPCYEEADYCLRLWQAGLRVVYEPGAVIDHYESGGETRGEDAIALVKRTRKRLRLRHTGVLKHHLPTSQVNILFARNRTDKRRRLLVIEDAVPLKALGFGFPRMCSMLNEAVAAGWFVTLYPLHLPGVNWDAAYADLSREIEICNGRGVPGLAGFLAERLGYYDTILVSRPSNMAPFKKAVRNQPHLLAGSRLIYDAEAISAAREILQANVEGRPMSTPASDALITQEINLTDEVDAVVAVSPAEAQLLRERQSAPVHILSHPTRTRWDTPGWKERAGFLFVGRLLDKTSPNYEGLIWFLRLVWPEIRAVLAQATLIVVGAVNGEPAELVGPGVQLLGQVEDLGPLFDRARVFISPIRFAAGVPIKILTAGASGLPVVGTKLMAAQLGWQPGVEIEANDDPLEMARAAIALYCDAERWEVMRTAMLHVLAREHSEARFRRELQALLEGNDRDAMCPPFASSSSTGTEGCSTARCLPPIAAIST